METDMDNKEINGDVPSPSEKRVYDLEFLMFLKDSPFSKVKPNIAFSDILRPLGDVSRPLPPPPGANFNLLPGFAKGARNTLPSRRSQGKPPLRPNTSMGTPKPNMRQINLSLRSDVKLNETENAWRPSRMRKEDLEEEEKETQEVSKKFRSVLNKLTPQKFDSLIAHVRDLNINTVDRLKQVINLVFIKAVEEPVYSVMYAQLCKELEQMKVTPTGEEKTVNFRSLIIGRCQEEFEKNDNQVNQADLKQKEVDDCDDPEKRKELHMALEEEKRKIRVKSVGNVKFIGELFKQNIITKYTIMLNCIQVLLSKHEEETLECLCKLLTTIGKDLETVYKQDLTRFFVDMQLIVDKKKGQNVSSRVRFMLQDVIDLRLKKWVPRKIVSQSNPKTMDQIQLEADLDQTYQQNNNYNSPSSSRQEDRYDRPMNKRGASRSNNEDGWDQARSRNRKFVDSEKLSIMSSRLQSSAPITSLSLSPAAASWGRGSNTKTINSPKNSNNVKKSTSIGTGNMYEMLQDLAIEPAAAPTTQKKLDNPVTVATPPPTSHSDNEDFGNDETGKIHNLLTKYQDEKVYSILDKVDRFLIKDNVPIDVIVKEMTLWAFEFGKLSTVNVIGEVTGRFIQNKILSKEQFLEIFKKVIDTSFDLFLEGDETSWDLLAGFVWGHLIKDPLTMSELHMVLSKLVKIGKGFEFMLAFFNMKTDVKAKTLWEDGEMNLSDWFSEDKVDKFKKSCKLKCFGMQQITDPTEAIEELSVFMKNKIPSSDIEKWIEDTIPNTEDIWFIRVLTEAVYKYALCSGENAKPRFDDQAKQRLNVYYPLLITFIGIKQKPDLELYCLYSLQHLINKLEHPMNVSTMLFEHLIDSGEVVSNETFLTWEVSQDPHEQEGKGVMLKTLTSFFTAIKSIEDSSSSEETSI